MQESKIKEPIKVSKNRICKFSNKDSDKTSKFVCPKHVSATKSQTDQVILKLSAKVLNQA